MSKRKIEFPHWNDFNPRNLHNPFDDVPISTLNNYEMELRKLVAAADKERTRLYNVKEMVDESLRRRTKPTTVIISDHAIVRYLERFEGLDALAICDKIAAMAENGDPEIAIRDGVIITVLPKGVEASKTDPRA